MHAILVQFDLKIFLTLIFLFVLACVPADSHSHTREKHRSQY